MAEEQQETPDEEAESGGGKLKKIIFIVVPALAVGAGVFFFFGGTGAEAASPTTTLAPVEGEVIEIDTVTVNLVGSEGRYARVGFAVVLDSMANSTVVGAKVPLMRDALLTTMTGFTADELQTADGMERLRQELSDAMVALFPDGEVLRAVLTDLIVQ